MEKTKKVIILDLDETLEHGIYQSRYDVGNQMTMVLRPNLDILLKKLYEVKAVNFNICCCQAVCMNTVYFSMHYEIR